MIRLLKGIIELQDGQHLLIDVNGVGYHVYATQDLLARSVIGEAVKVFIYTHVREDMLDLYGFSALEDLKLFEQFLNVSGIGPKTAIGIFAVGSRERIITAIATNDVTFFASVPRLGKKNAQKIIIELKSKLGSLEDLDLSSPTLKADEEVIDALKGFGFSTKEALDALRSLDTEVTSVSEKIRLSLKQLGK
ncbi:MAG TPA: Holliday junction branch migration protein RuvA [Candidatus Saccharimonadales bacterium]|nr:Holliday junction branch migration protein RuvA [Candidatus Saccharimonadales bacterium]